MTAHDHHHGSLNPALEEARFCPRCAAPAEIHVPRSLSCPTCGYQWFSNPSPVAGAIPVEPDGRIWLLKRGFAPAKGLWTFPGGFVDLGESVEDAARREAREEIGIDLPWDRLAFWSTEQALKDYLRSISSITS